MFVKNDAKVVKIFRRLMVDRFNNFRREIKQILSNRQYFSYVDTRSDFLY